MIRWSQSSQLIKKIGWVIWFQFLSLITFFSASKCHIPTFVVGFNMNMTHGTNFSLLYLLIYNETQVLQTKYFETFSKGWVQKKKKKLVEFSTKCLTPRYQGHLRYRVSPKKRPPKSKKVSVFH